MSETDFEKMMDSLDIRSCPEGMERIMEDIFKYQRNIFFHGFAGTGKSTRIKFIKEYIEKYNIKNKTDVHVALTSTTGVSAINIGGVTIHSLSGLGYGKGSGKEIVRKMGGAYKNIIQDRLRSINVTWIITR
jgi:hypothetical protein